MYNYDIKLSLITIFQTQVSFNGTWQQYFGPKIKVANIKWNQWEKMTLMMSTNKQTNKN